MNPIRIFACALLVVSMAACQGNDPSTAASKPSTSPQAPESALGRAVGREIDKAREKLANENIGLNNSVSINRRGGGVSILNRQDANDDRPKAEISPKGDLLIEGKPVAINDEQRAMLLEYRAHVIGIAESGMEIGVQGADLAAKAMGEAFKGLFSGKSEQEIEKSVEAEAAGIKQSAAKLCARLPEMLASQQKLAAALPEFQPYATMTQDDVDDCMDESKHDAASQAQLQAEIRQEIRTAIRSSVRTAVDKDATEAAAEAQSEAQAEPDTATR